MTVAAEHPEQHFASSGHARRDTSRFGRIGTGVLALVGIAASLYLLDVHATVAAGQLSGGLCGVSETVNCNSVATSEYASILGIPIALLGLGFYAAVLLLTLLATGLERRHLSTATPRVTASGLLHLGFAAGTLYSVFLLVVSLGVIGSFCPVCGVLYGVNALGFVSTGLWGQAWTVSVLRRLARAHVSVLKEPGLWLSVAAMVAVVALGLPLLEKHKASAVLAAAVASEVARDSDASERVPLAKLVAQHAPSKGPKDAPVVIVEFSNFGCPFCARLANEFSEVMRTHGDKVRVLFRHYPLREEQVALAHLAVCAAEQDRFWPMHDALFARMPVTDPTQIKPIADEVGVDLGELIACAQSSETARMVAEDYERGQALGIEGTPTFFINGRKHVGAMPAADLRALIDAEIEDSVRSAPVEDAPSTPPARS